MKDRPAPGPQGEECAMTWYIVRHAEKVFGGYYNAELRH